MSRKHNVRHNRTQSRYPQRLAARGLRATDVIMDTLEELRKPHRVKIQEAATAYDAERAIEDHEQSKKWPEFYKTESSHDADRR